MAHRPRVRESLLSTPRQESELGIDRVSGIRTLPAMDWRLPRPQEWRMRFPAQESRCQFRDHGLRSAGRDRLRPPRLFACARRHGAAERLSRSAGSSPSELTLATFFRTAPAVKWVAGWVGGRSFHPPAADSQAEAGTQPGVPMRSRGGEGASGSCAERAADVKPARSLEKQGEHAERQDRPRSRRHFAERPQTMTMRNARPEQADACERRAQCTGGDPGPCAARREDRECGDQAFDCSDEQCPASEAGAHEFGIGQPLGKAEAEKQAGRDPCKK